MIHYTQLGNFLTEYSDRNEGNKYRPVAVGRYGIRTRESIYSKELAKDYSKNKLIYKDTLTVGMGSVQIDIGILTEEAIYSVSPAYHTYRIVGINTDYLRYCLECRNQDMFVRFAKRGSRQGKTIDLKRWLTYEIPVHDVATQKEIVRMLNHVCALIEQRLQQMEEIDQLVKSRFIEMFGTQSHNEKDFMYGRIDGVADIYLGLTHTPNYVGDGVKFISAKNTSGDFLDLNDVKYISKEEFDNAPAGAKPKRGDMLFSRVGSNLGHPVILETDEELCTFVSLGFLRAKEKVTALYLKHWMRDDFFAEQVRQKVVGGGQPNLNTGWLKEFKIIIPPMELQNQFAAFVQATDKSKYYSSLSLECCRIAANKYRQEWMICQILNF